MPQSVKKKKKKKVGFHTSTATVHKWQTLQVALCHFFPPSPCHLFISSINKRVKHLSGLPFINSKRCLSKCFRNIYNQFNLLVRLTKGPTGCGDTCLSLNQGQLQYINQLTFVLLALNPFVKPIRHCGFWSHLKEYEATRCQEAP